jgi:hypothetical protein
MMKVEIVRKNKKNLHVMVVQDGVVSCKIAKYIAITSKNSNKAVLSV